MKKLLFILISFFVIIIISGCETPSENTSEQPVNALNKVTEISFSGHHYPTGPPTDPGEVKTAGQNLIIKNMKVDSRYDSENELVSGFLYLTINAKYDLATGEGPVHGKWYIIPDAYPDAVWKGIFSGYRYKTGDSEWTEKVRIVGRGFGGEIEGMHVKVDEVALYDHIYGETGFDAYSTGVIKYNDKNK